MPYQVQSPIAAGIDALSGFLSGQTQKKQYQAQQAQQAQNQAQAEADTQARLSLARETAQNTQAYRTSQLSNEQTRLGIEQSNAAAEAAARAAAKAKQDKIDAFEGGGLKYPSNWTTMKPEQKIAYLQVRLNKATQAGDRQIASETETEMNRVATQAAADKRQAEQDKRDAEAQARSDRMYQLALARSTRPRGGSAIQRNAQGLTPEEVIQNQHWDTEHPKGGKPAKTPEQKARNLNPDEVRTLTKLGSAIPNSPDPVRALHNMAQQWNLTLDQAASFVP